MDKRLYNFTSTGDGIHVLPSDLYTDEKGFGFVIEKNRATEDALKYPEVNSAFNVFNWFAEKEITEIKGDASGCYTAPTDIIKDFASKNTCLLPLIFKCKLPIQGNYEVSLTLSGTADALKNVMVFSGRRRLMYYSGSPVSKECNPIFEEQNCAASSKLKLDFVVNITDIVPRGITTPVEDTTLDITIIGNDVHITELTVSDSDVPTIYIAGDSTVTDQTGSYPYVPEACYSGWGQMLSLYFPKGIAVANHAHSGLTTSSFRSEKHHDIVMKFIKPGDYFFMQFAHNDQKLKSLTANGGYRENIIRYIEEIRAVGAHPVIVTPLSRNTWKGEDGTFNDLLIDYANECKKIGQEYSVPVIDLHKRSVELVLKYGLEPAKVFYFPKDYTHSNDYGAIVFAEFVTREILEVFPNDSIFHKNVASFESFPALSLPAKAAIPEIPEGFAQVEAKPADKLEGYKTTRPDETLIRAEAFDIVMKAANFFATNVYNDMFTDIVGHEWFAGSVECAYQNGLITNDFVINKQVFPNKEITLAEFLVVCINGYKSRKSLPTPAEVSKDILATAPDWTHEYIQYAAALDILPGKPLSSTLTRKEAAELADKMKL